MNESPQPISTAPATAAQVVACPRCGTQLRLARAVSDQTPIKCYSCKAVFCQEPIETLPADPVVPPVLNAVRPPAPSAAPARVSEFTSPPFPLTNKPPAMQEPPRPPQAAPVRPVSAPAPTMAAAPVAIAPPIAAQRTTPAAAPATTAAPVAPASAVPGAPAPQVRRVLQLGPQETMVAGILVLALLAGGIAAGTLYFRGGRTADAPETDQDSLAAKAKPEQPVGVGPLDKPVITPSRLKTIPPPPSLPADVAARTAELVGYWESRSDDGSYSSLDLRADETATLLPATDNPAETELLQGRWALVKQQGETFTLDVIYTQTGLEVHRMTVELSLPDAITIISSAFRGRVMQTEQRFVRRRGSAG